MAEETAQDAVSVRRATVADAQALTDIQYATITWGELRNLGPGFFTLLHKHFITSPDAICYVAVKNGKVIGYSAWAYDTKKFYASFKKKYLVPAAFAVLPHLLNPGNWRALFRGLTYAESSNPDDPAAEMLFFSILPEGRSGGVGSKLFDPMLAEMKAKGVKRLKAATVTPTNEVAIKFYDRRGFKCVRTDGFYSDTKVLVYVLDLT